MARSITAGRSAPRREPDRPSRLRLWLKRRRGLAKPAALGLLAMGALGAVGVGLYLADPAGRVQALAEGAAEWGEAAGFVVSGTTVEFAGLEAGARPNTPRELIDAALGISPGDPILGFSPADARKRLLELPWVEDAQVERRLPGAIHVRLHERPAFAIWQKSQTEFVVIGRNGKELTREHLGSFVHLPFVVGAGANTAGFAFYELLRAHEPILARTQAMVRVGERRWNLRLHNGVDVLLPEDQEAPALNRLAELHARHALLDRPLVAIDMRLPDRLVLRQPPAPEPPPNQRRQGNPRG